VAMPVISSLDELPGLLTGIISRKDAELSEKNWGQWLH